MTIALIDLALITVRLASLQTDGTVDYISAAASESAALARGAVHETSLWIVPTDVIVADVGNLARHKQVQHGFSVIAVLRDHAPAPDTGAIGYETLRDIRNAVIALLAPEDGWKPSGFTQPVRYIGGRVLNSTEQLVATADDYEVLRYGC